MRISLEPLVNYFLAVFWAYFIARRFFVFLERDVLFFVLTLILFAMSLLYTL